MTPALFACFVTLAIACYAAEMPRIFITSGQTSVSGEADVADLKGSLSLVSGSGTEDLTVVKSFTAYCPGIRITSSRDRADYIVRFDRDDPSPITPFVRGNKVAIFDKNDDLVYSHTTRLLRNTVRGACTALQKLR